MTSGNITRSTTSHVKGAALRIIKDGMEINGSISDATFDKLTKLAQKLASTFTEKRIAEVEPFKEVKAGGQVKIKPTNSSIDPLKLLGEASQAAKDFSPEIVQVIGNFWRRHQNIQVFASDGTWAFDEDVKPGYLYPLSQATAKTCKPSAIPSAVTRLGNV